MPALVGGAVVGGVLGGVLPAVTGAGKNTFRASDFADTNKYDRNAQYFGSDPNMANNMANQYGSLAGDADRRDFISADFGNANQARGMGMDARGDQSQALAMMRARAMGQAPSIAQMQGNYALGQALNDQQSAVASARGGAGAQALAARAAMLGGAQMRGNIAGQSAIAAAQERQAAEQGYFGGASGMRGQDMNLQGLDQQGALGQAGLSLQSRGQNDARSMGFYGMRNQILDAQQRARAQNQQMLANTHMAADQINSGINSGNANADMNYWKGGMAGAQGGMQAGMAISKGSGGGGAPGGGGGYNPNDPGY